MASSSQPTLPEALICFCVRAAEGVNRTEYKLFSASWVGVGGAWGHWPTLGFPKLFIYTAHCADCAQTET